MAIIEFEIDDVRNITEKELGKLITEIGLEPTPDGKKMKVDVTPDRPELLSFRLLNMALEMYAGRRKASKSDYFYKRDAYLSIDASAAPLGREFISGVVGLGLDLEDNELEYLIDFAEKLSETFGRKRSKIAVGIHDAKKINGSLRYYSGSEESFVPLGQNRSMGFEEIIKKHQKGIEYAHTISRNGYPVLRDSEKVISFIPIINSRATMVTSATSDVFVDITGREPHSVAYAAELFGCLLREMGGEIRSVRIKDRNGTRLTPHGLWRNEKINAESASEIIGTRLKNTDIRRLLARMGYVSLSDGKNIKVGIPPYRNDVFDMNDLIEDVAIAYGYGNIKPARVQNSPYGALRDDSTYLKVSMRLVGAGFNEAINQYLSSIDSQFSKMGRKMEKNGDEGLVMLDYSKNSNFQMLRDSLLPSLLSNLASSANDQMPHRLFEYGKAFGVKNGEAVEWESVCIAISHSKANLSEIRGTIDQIIGLLYKEVTIDRFDDPAFIKGRCGALFYKSNRIGVFGELHPETLRKFKIDEPVSCCEILVPSEKK
jgi:phenylalanyl-tRNA synthetase, beta subunit